MITLADPRISEAFFNSGYKPVGKNHVITLKGAQDCGLDARVDVTQSSQSTFVALIELCNKSTTPKSPRETHVNYKSRYLRVFRVVRGRRRAF